MFSSSKLYISISDDSIKFIKAKKTKKSIYIDNFSQVYFDSNKELDINLLKTLLLENKIKDRNAFVLLSSNKIIIKTLELNKLKIKDIDKYIKHNLTDFFTVNIDNYLFDYKILNSFVKENKEYYSILLAAIPKIFFNSIIDMCNIARINPYNINIYPNTISELFMNEEENIGILDVHNNSVEFISLNKKNIFMYTNFNSNDTDDLINNFEYSEEYNYIENISSNTLYYLNFFSNKHYGQKISHLYTFGNESIISQITKQLEKQTELNIYQNKIPILLEFNKKILNKNEIYNFISLVSLPNYTSKTKDINFITPILKQKKKETFKRVVIITTIFLLLSYTAYIFGKPFFIKSKNVQEINSLLSHMNQLSNVEEIYLEYEESRKELRNKERIVEQLNEDAFDMVKIINHIYNVIPNTISISSMKFTSKGKINLIFVSNKTLDTANLLTILDSLDLFRKVDIDTVNINDNKQEISFVLEIQEHKKELYLKRSEK